MRTIDTSGTTTNTIPAYLNLFDLFDCEVILAPEPRQPTLNAILDARSLRLHEAPSAEELLGKRHPHFPYDQTFESAQSELLVVLHTSGTTTLPKAIIWTHDFAGSYMMVAQPDPPKGFGNLDRL